MTSGRILLLGIFIPAIAATVVTALMQQFPTEFVGSQHDSLHIALRFANSELFPNDAFVSSARHQPTLLWHAIGALVPLAGEGGVRALTLGVMLLNLLFFLGVGAVTRALGGGAAACVGAIAVLCGMGDPLVGANYILANHVTASSVVAGPLLFALALAIRGRLAACFVLIGLCANVHVLQSAYVGGLIIAGEVARALLLRRDVRALDWRALLPLARGLAIAAGCALPVLWMIVTGPRGAVPDGWADVITRGHVIHYFLFSQLALQQLRALALLILGAGIAVAWWRSTKKTTAFFLAGVLLAWVVGFVLLGGLLTDVVKLPLAIKVQPLRATVWVLFLVVPAAWVALERSARDGNSSVVAWALAGVMLTMLVLNVLRPFGGAFNLRLAPFVVLFSLVILAAPLFGKRLHRYVAILAALAFVGPASVGGVVLGIIPGFQVLGTDAGLQMTVLLLFVLGLVWASRGFLPPLSTCRASAVAWIVALVLVGLVLLNRVETNAPLLLTPRDESWHEAANFIAESTPVNAVIQSDPRRTGLRSLARRGVFFEMNDDGALYFDPASLAWLRERAELLRVPLVKSYGRPAPWPMTNVPWSLLAREHGVTHAMLPSEEPVGGIAIPGRVIFENAEWRVIELEP